MTNEVARIESAFSSIQKFEECQRMAKVFSESSFVPANFKGKIGDCVIALDMAQRMGADVIALMQNMYIVHGKPSFSSSFLIACINSSGRFSPLRYIITGEGDERSCTAWALDQSGERLESVAVTIRMAKAEGWYTKAGSKWQTMTDLMLRYRAATFFARQFCPEITMGMRTQEELMDAVEVQDGNGNVITQAANITDEQPTARKRG
jgi:hypothetical protein